MTQWEQLRLEATEMRVNSEWLKAAQLCEKRYDMDASDVVANYNACNNYLRANYPHKALELWNEFDMRYRDMHVEIAWWEAQIADAYNRTGQYRKALETTESYPFPKMYRWNPAEHLKALIRLDSFEVLSRQLEVYRQSGFFDGGGEKEDAGFLFHIICNELSLIKNEVLLKQYAQQFYEWSLENKAEPDFWGFRNRTYAAFYLRDYEQAIEWLEEDISQDKPSIRKIVHSALLGVAYAPFEDLVKPKG